MTMKGKVTGALSEKLCRAVEDRGIAVWYDPKGEYRESLSVLDLKGFPLLEAESDKDLFRLRKELEPFLEFVTDDGTLKDDPSLPSPVIVYVPFDRKDCHDALIEAESTGTVLEPGALDPERNTALAVLVRNVFGKIAPLKVEELTQQAEKGMLSPEDFDKIAEDTSEGVSATLRILFENKSSPGEILLLFAASKEYDGKIEEKRAMDEIMVLAALETGLEGVKADLAPSEFRAVFARHLLLGELLGFLSEGERPCALEKIFVSRNQVHSDNIRHLCDTWRKRSDLKESYKTTAVSLEGQNSLESLSYTLSCLEECETFPFLEKLHLEQAADDILSGVFEKGLELARLRHSLFWPVETPLFHVQWQVIELAASLIGRAQKIRSTLKKNVLSVDDFILAYTGSSDPWMLLDRTSRQLESWYARLDVLDFPGDSLEKVLHAARRAYFEAVHELSSSYTSAFEKTSGIPHHVLPHTSIFHEKVRPCLDEGKRTAYLLVDALRYEMAAELAEAFEEESEVRLQPVWGTLPGITVVGMATLLPGAQKGLSLEEKNGKLSVLVDGRVLNTREARMEYIREVSGVPTVALKLGEVVKLTAKKKKEVESSQLLVVTSQEIDRLGEEGSDEEETRIYMDDVLEKIRRAVRSLSRCGFTQFFIVADHGYQIVADKEPGLDMPPPGGETFLLHPRVWVGRGGTGGEGFFRRQAKDIGLGGELEFAFPRGLGVFKTKGGSGLYFHGGISPQEHILPLLSIGITGKSPEEETLGMTIELALAKKSITNRIFMITVEGSTFGLFPTDEKKIRIEVTSGKTEVGIVLAAAYGFDEASKETVIQAGKPNSVTVMLAPDANPKTLSISAVDPESQMVLHALKGIPVDLTI